MEEPSIIASGSSKDILYLYTGTSCINNGTDVAEAAVCVCFNEDENYTVSELLNDEPITNQKAELRSIELALKLIKDEKTITIVSRSTYAIDCINEVWKSKKEGSKSKKNKKSFVNVEIIDNTLSLLNELRSQDKHIELCHSSRMPNKKGNNIAQNNARRVLLTKD